MAYNIILTREGMNNTSGTTVSAASFTPTAGSSLIALVMFAHPTSLAAFTASLTDTSGGNDSWSLLGATASNESLAVDVWYGWYVLNNAAATSTVVQATASGTVTYDKNIIVFEVSGLDSTPYLGQAFNGQNTPTTATDAVTSTATGSLASQPALVLGVSCNVDSYAGNPAVGTGYTSVGTYWAASTTYARAEHKRVTATSAVTATFTAGGDFGHWTTVIALKESAGGATYTPRATLLGVG
jgi:hypothetical protein